MSIKKIVAAIGYGLFYAFAWTVAWFPLPVLYVLSDGISFLVHRVVRYRLKVVRNNIRNSFPDKPVKELREIESRFYHHLCDYCFELLKLFHISDQELDKRLKVTNIELLYDQLDKGRNIIMLMSHYGNWDWLTTFQAKLRPGITLAAVYRPLTNHHIDAFFIRMRERFNTYNIAKNNTLRAFIRIKQSNTPHIIGMVSDQTPSKNNLEYWTTFLNQDTPVLTGMERIARQLDFSVYYLDMKVVKRGYYSCTLSVITNKPAELPEHEITERFIRKVEETVQRDPAYYLWSHKRWKHRRTTSPQPSPTSSALRAPSPKGEGIRNEFLLERAESERNI